MSSSPDPLGELAITRPSSPNESTHAQTSQTSPILKHKIKSIIMDPAIKLDLKLAVLNRHRELRQFQKRFTAAYHEARSKVTELGYQRRQVQHRIGLLRKSMRGCSQELHILSSEYPKIEQEWQLQHDDQESGPLSFRESSEYMLWCKKGDAMITKGKRLHRVQVKLCQTQRKLEMAETNAQAMYAKAQTGSQKVAQLQSALAEQVQRILSNKAAQKVGERLDGGNKSPRPNCDPQSCLSPPTESDEEYDADDDSEQGSRIAAASNASVASDEIASATATYGSRDDEHMIYDFIEEVKAELNRREDAVEVREKEVAWKEKFLEKKAGILVKNARRIVRYLKRKAEESGDTTGELIQPKRRRIQ